MAIYIDREIGKIQDNNGNYIVNGIVLQDVINQVKAMGDVSEIIVWLATSGGDLQVAEDIHDYLKSLKKKIIVHAKGVHSAGTKILLAGDERIGYKGVTSSLIHSTMPVIQEAGVYNSRELIEMGEGSNELTDDLVKFYADKTGNTKEAFAPLVRDETELTAEQMLSLGFLTEIREQRPAIKSVAFKTKKSNNMSEEVKELEKKTQKEFSAVNNVLAKISKKLGIGKTANMVIQDANGTAIDFFEKEEGSPEVGDKANVDGSAADGEYTLADGTVVTFDKGVVTEVKPADSGDDDDAEMTALKEENERLKQELQVSNEKVEQSQTETKEEVKALSTAFANLKKTVTSNFNVNLNPDNPKGDQDQKPTSRTLFKSKKD